LRQEEANMVLDDVFLNKLLNKCLAKYFGEAEISHLSKKEIAELKVKIQKAAKGESGEALYVIIEDIVYDHLTT
jgi:cytochrome b involved in lipid metabolism